MLNKESIPENEMHKILYDFETQTGHLILDRLSDSQQKKDDQPNSGLCTSDWPQSKTERKWKER